MKWKQREKKINLDSLKFPYLFSRRTIVYRFFCYFFFFFPFLNRSHSKLNLLTMRNEYKIRARIRSKEYMLPSRGKETCFIFYFIQIVASSKLRTVRQLVPTFLFDLTFDLLLFQFMEYIYIVRGKSWNETCIDSKRGYLLLIIQ